MDHFPGDWRIPTPAQSVAMSHFDMMIEAYEEHGGKQSEYASYLKTQKAYAEQLRENGPKLCVTVIYFNEMASPIFWDDTNQTVTVTRQQDPIEEWFEEHAERKCVIPHSDLMGPFAWSRNNGENPIDSMLINSPNAYESRYGNWRDWILEVKAVTAAGDLVTFGSKVVKNVAGFDLARFTVGSRGTLCIPYEVTFRTTPVSDVTKSDVVFARKPGFCEYSNWKQRMPIQHLDDAVRQGRESVIAMCPISGQLWAKTEVPLARFPNDSVMRSGAFEKCIEVTAPKTQALMRRTKQLFDPTNKLNPGEFGFL